MVGAFGAAPTQTDGCCDGQEEREEQIHTSDGDNAKAAGALRVSPPTRRERVFYVAAANPPSCLDDSAPCR